VTAARAKLQTLHQNLADRFWHNEPIESLMRDLSDGIDAILTDLFHHHFSDDEGIAIYAVGGFGRAEVQPGSDIDLLVLAEKPSKHKRTIELFLQNVFDLNVEVGHSVRDPKSCRKEAKLDLTVATALFERRFISGDNRLSVKLDKLLDSPRLWPADKFFHAKYAEQKQRHKNYNNTEYNLEPNLKSSPGGLRDIHTAMWVYQRKFGTKDPARLVDLGVITATEHAWLIEGRRFLWWVRFGLHILAGRKEDQLQFGYQRELSERLGFVETDAQPSVERFMQHYYRHVLALTEVNDILLQHFAEDLVPARKTKVISINTRFQMVNNYIETTSEQVFNDNPAALLELFVIMANRNDIAGVRASTIRQVRENLHLIDDDFRHNPAHTQLFMDLLKAPYTLVSQLTRMRRYGVLGRYIPEFGRIIGQMQHDLFHIYTVDAHTMMLIGNMRRFRYRSSVENFPVAYHCVHRLPKLELLYLSGLYHDIGKGRGGDHSELGAIDAVAFCQRHHLSPADTELVKWLVEKHLYMSSVAQRQDIYDPDVIQKFAIEVKSEMRLNYLYTLTVADINATNPTLWNSWRATLLRQLYNETRKVLRRGIESAVDRNASIQAYQERAFEKLSKAHPELTATDIHALWQNVGDDFFLRHTPPQIATMTELLVNHDLNDGPLVDIRDTQGDLSGEGATLIYVYCKDQSNLFAATVLGLGKFQLEVMDAVVSTSESGVCFDCYAVLTAEHQPLPRNPLLRNQIKDHVAQVITLNSAKLKLPKRRLPRRLRELPRPTEVHIKPSGDDSASTITIIASNRAGLLTNIAILFVELKLSLLSAKITTLGERIEDTFVVQTEHRAAIGTGEPTYMLEHTMRQHLDQKLGLRARGSRHQ